MTRFSARTKNQPPYLFSKKRKSFFIFITFLILLGITSCGLIDNLNNPSLEYFQIDDDSNIGQTFVGNHNGLNSIHIFLDPMNNQEEGVLNLQIKQDPESVDSITTSIINLKSIKTKGMYSFSFRPISETNNKSFFFLLELKGEGTVYIGLASNSKSINGTAYIEGKPVREQVLYEIGYSWIYRCLDILFDLVQWLFILLKGILIFIIPGWALLKVLWSDWENFDWPIKTGLAGGVSLVIYPISMLWTNVINFHPYPIFIWFPSIAGSSYLLISFFFKNKLSVFHRSKFSLKTLIKSIPTYQKFFIILLGLIFISRFWTIRNIEAPLWGDSVSHTVIAQLLGDNKGLFSDWLPYYPYDSFTLQFGFPASVTSWYWLTGNTTLKATLVVGQFINVLAILALYPLTIKITKGNTWAGLGSLFIAGLVSTLPGGYVNWGRYAQLTGQTILPVAMFLTISCLDRDSLISNKHFIKKIPWTNVILTALTICGMTLAYYRMYLFYGAFLAAFLIGKLLDEKPNRLKEWIFYLIILLIVCTFSIIFFLPWLNNVQGGVLANQVETTMKTIKPIDTVLVDYQIWKNLFQYVPIGLVLLFLLGIAVAIKRREWLVISIGIWTILLSSLVVSQLIRLPGASFMQNFAVLIALYMPVSIVSGYVLAYIYQWFSKSQFYTSVFKTAGFILLMIWCVSGFWQQHKIANPEFFSMLTSPDIKAFEWIRKNTPINSIFLVEGLLIPPGETAIGTDAGWWLPLLTLRQNTMPPQYAMLNEFPFDPDYNKKLISLVSKLETNLLSSKEGVKLLCDNGITHIYIGQGQGQVSFGNQPLFIEEELASSSAYESQYRRDLVSIYRLKPEACSKQ